MDLVFHLNACCCPSRHLQKNAEVVVASLSLADEWQACSHRAGTTSGASGDQARVMQSASCSLRFVFPSAAVASCDKLHLGCDAILPWGWDNSLLGTVVNLGRSGSPQGKNPVSPCVHLGLGRAAANAIR